MARWVYATLVGLVGAALVHLMIVLLLPQLSANDVWRQIASETKPFEPTRLDRAGNGIDIVAAKSLDPMFAVTACRFDLTDGPLLVTAPGNGDFWSVAVFDDYGRIVFSANDRIVATEDLALVVALPLQMRVMQQNPRPELEQTVSTESNRSEGFVVVRAFRPDATWEPSAEEFLHGVDCRPIRL